MVRISSKTDIVRPFIYFVYFLTHPFIESSILEVKKGYYVTINFKMSGSPKPTVEMSRIITERKL